MIKADEIIKKQNIIIDQVNLLGNLVGSIESSVGLDASESKVIIKNLGTELRSKFKILMDEALKPVPPRAAKKILQDIQNSERVSPELLKEIRALLKQSPIIKESKDSKASKGAKPQATRSN